MSKNGDDLDDIAAAIIEYHLYRELPTTTSGVITTFDLIYTRYNIGDDTIKRVWDKLESKGIVFWTLESRQWEVNRPPLT